MTTPSGTDPDPSGQSRGIFASVQEYKAGEESRRGHADVRHSGRPRRISILPSVGIYHQNRIEILKDGNILVDP